MVINLVIAFIRISRQSLLYPKVTKNKLSKNVRVALLNILYKFYNINDKFKFKIG